MADKESIRVTNCEWMFGDAATGWLGFNALAHVNPLRWSGAQTFTKSIADLQDVASHGGRPILVKIPANSTSLHNFPTTQEAIDFLKQEDPIKKIIQEFDGRRRKSEENMKATKEAKEKAERLRPAEERIALAQETVKLKQKDAEEKYEEEMRAKGDLGHAETNAEAKAHDVLQFLKQFLEARSKAWEMESTEQVSWMFADVGLPLPNVLGTFAKAAAEKNPLRWTEGKVHDIMKELDRLTEKNKKRRIRVSSKGEELEFENANVAIQHLYTLCPAKGPLWKEAQKAEEKVKEAELETASAKEAAKVLQDRVLKAHAQTAVAEQALSAAKQEEEEAQESKTALLKELSDVGKD